MHTIQDSCPLVFFMVAANNPLGAKHVYWCEFWGSMLLVLAAAKQVGLRCSQGFARSTGDVRQPGRLFQVIQAVDWFVPEHHLSVFKVSFLRGVQKGWEN